MLSLPCTHVHGVSASARLGNKLSLAAWTGAMVQVIGDTAESIFEMTNDQKGMQALTAKEATITLLGKVTIRSMRAEDGSALAVQGAGGKIHIKADTQIAASTRVNVQFCGAVSGTYGAGVVKDGGILHVASGSLRFADCSSPGTGGAITVQGAGAEVNLEGEVTFERCSAATNGGAVAVLGGANFTCVSATAASSTSFVQASGVQHAYSCRHN
jgi:hypothetical protein